MRLMLLSLFDNFIPTKPEANQEKSRVETFEISVNDLTVPVKIIFEERFNNRVKVNSNGITMHISARQPKEEQRKNIDHFIQWSKNKLGEKPDLLDHLPQRKYVNGEVLSVGQHDFYISVFFHEQPKSTAKLFTNNIAIALAKGLSPDAQASTNSYLVAKCLTNILRLLLRNAFTP
jgi:hypothetical protein